MIKYIYNPEITELYFYHRELLSDSCYSEDDVHLFYSLTYSCSKWIPYYRMPEVEKTQVGIIITPKWSKYRLEWNLVGLVGRVDQHE